MGQAVKKLGLTNKENFLETFDSTEILVSCDFLDGIFEPFLKAYFFPEGEILKISGAEIVESDSKTVSVTGKADFLGIPNVPTKALFEFLDDGRVSPRIEFDMLQRGQSSDYWQFRKSFPLMPSRPAISSPYHGELEKTFADEFIYKEVKVIVCDSHCYEDAYQRDLTPGINVLAKANFYGGLSVISHMLSNDSESVVYGKIIRPKFDTNYFAEALKAMQTRAHNQIPFPWDYCETLPGLHLESDIGEDVSFDKLSFGQPKLRIYCPFDDWSSYDTIYKTQKAITGVIDLPKANIKVEGVGVMASDSLVTIYTRFQGLSIENLSQIAGFEGASDFESHLPTPLQTTVKELKKLEILDLAFTVKKSAATGQTVPKLALSYAMVNIGFRELQWELWDDHIIVDGLSFRFELIDSEKKTIRASFTAASSFNNLPITITGTKWGKQYIINASLDNETTLPFKAFMKRYAPDLPVPGDLTIDSFSLEICLGSYVSVTGSLANEPDAWEIDVGSTTIAVENLSFELNKIFGTSAGQGSLQGFVTGTIELDEFTLQVNYALPNNLTLKANIPSLQLSKLQKQLTGSTLGGPSGFDLELSNTQLVAKVEKTALQFKALSTIHDLGMLAFQIGKTNNEWGAAAGVYLEDARLSEIDGLEFLSPIDKAIQFKDLTIIVSSLDDANFRFPSSAEFNDQQGQNSTGIRLPEAPSGVSRGLCAHGTWILNKKDRVHKLLLETFGLDEGLPVTVQVSNPQGRPPSVHLFASVAGEFDNTPFRLQVGLKMQSGSRIEYYVTGRGEISIDKQKMMMDLGVSVTISGFSLSGSLQGTLDLHGLKLSDLGFMGSINWAGVPGFGFAGRINTKAFQSSIVMLVDSANMGMVLAGSISELTAYKVLTGVVGLKQVPKELVAPLKKVELRGTQEFKVRKGLVKDLDSKNLRSISEAFSKSGNVSLSSSENDSLLVVNKKGKKWYLTNRRDKLKTFQIELVNDKVRIVVAPQIYICTSYSRIGSQEFQPGFLLSARIKVFDFEAYASIDISPSKGIAIDAYINKPIIIANRNFFILSDVRGKKGPFLSVGTYSQPQHPVQAYRSPHLMINGRLKIMGLQLDCYAEISAKALKIDANLKLKNRISNTIVKGSTNFDVSVKADVGNISSFYAKFAVSFDVDLGLYLAGVRTVDLKETIAGGVEVGLKNGKPYATLAAGLKVCGQTCKITVHLTPGKDSIKDIGKFLAEEVGDFFDDIYQDVEKFIEDVGKGILKGFEETEKLGEALVDEFTQSAHDVASAFDNLGHDIETITKALDKHFSATAKEIGDVLSTIGKPVEDIAKGLKAVGHGIEDVGDALLSIGHVPEEIAGAFSHINLSPNQISKALSSLSIKPLDISDAVSSLEISNKDVERALKAVSIDTKSLEKSINSAVSDVTEFFDDVGKAIVGVVTGKKKKKKKRKRKARPEEIVKSLNKITDNYDFIYEKILKVGHSSNDAVNAIIKGKTPSIPFFEFLTAKLRNDDHVFRQLLSCGWSDLNIIRQLKKARYTPERIALILKLNGYAPKRLDNTFAKVRYPKNVRAEAIAYANSRVFANAHFYTAHQQFVRAEDGGGKAVKGDRRKAQSHETFKLVLIKAARNAPDDIRDGCKIAVLTHNHRYFKSDKKGNLDAGSIKAGIRERFTLVNHTAKDRPIKKGDVVSLMSHYKSFMVADKKSVMRANRKKIGSWEKFVIK